MEEELKKMSDYHRKQSGLTDKDNIPSPQAYEENKEKYDSLAKRVSSNKNYEILRQKIRDKGYKDKKKEVVEIQVKTGGIGWSKGYADNFEKIFK